MWTENQMCSPSGIWSAGMPEVSTIAGVSRCSLNSSYWARDYQPGIYSGSYQLNLAGDGGSKGIVIFINTSN